MIQWHRFVQPVSNASEMGMQSSMILIDGNLLVNCGGDGDVLVGVSGDERHVCVRLNGESHQYERALLRRVVVNGARGNHDIELSDQTFDMLVVAHGAKGETPPAPLPAMREFGDDLHARRAKRHRADDFGLV
jgi:hypothetical protein